MYFTNPPSDSIFPGSPTGRTRLSSEEDEDGFTFQKKRKRTNKSNSCTPSTLKIQKPSVNVHDISVDNPDISNKFLALETSNIGFSHPKNT